MYEISREIPVDTPAHFFAGGKPVFTAYGCALLEHEKDSGYTYTAVNLKTGRAVLLSRRRYRLSEAGFPSIAERIRSLPIADRGRYEVDRKPRESATRQELTEILSHIFINILPGYGYAVRENQIGLAEHILKTIAQCGVCLAESEVGTGKTHAYLIAAALVRRGRLNDFNLQGRYPRQGYDACIHMPMVIATSSIALQRAIVKDYIPELSRILIENGIIRTPLNCFIRKGKEHYLCERRLLTFYADAEARTRAAIKPLLAADVSCDLADTDGLTAYMKQKICVAGKCDANCRYHKNCRYINYLATANGPAVDFIVSNHNYFLADTLHRVSGKCSLLQNYQAVIIDEAHKFLGAARQMYGIGLDSAEIPELVDAIHSFTEGKSADGVNIHRLAKKLGGQSERLFQRLDVNAEERVAVLKLLGISTVTVDESLDLFYQIISTYENGTYGTLTAYVYYFDNPGDNMQPVFVGFLDNTTTTNYSVYVKLSKTLSGTSGYFAGAVFGIYRDSACTDWISNITTTSSEWTTSNEIRITNETATLYIKETSSGDASVTKNSGVFSVSVNTNTNGTAATAAAVTGDGADGSIVNTAVTPPPSGPNIVLQKIDAHSGAGLGGAVFKLEGNATFGGYVSTNVTSVADGTVTLQWSDPAGDNYIAPGEYTVTEEKAPAGYEKSDEARHLRLWLEDDGGNYVPRSSGTLVFENYRQHSVIFRKISESGAGLAGAVFDVYRNGTKLGSYTTGGGGTITIPNVTTGYYEFVETSPPAGYLLPATTSTGVYVDTTDSTITEHYLTMVNYEYPEIVIQKSSSTTNLPLAGATFEVMIDGAVLGTFTTTSTGKININYAQYKDYLTDGNEIWTVTVTEVSAPDGYFDADPATQTNQLKKGQALSAFSFKNQPYPDVVAHKTDSKTGEPLGNVTFTLEGVSSGASYVQTTGDDGLAIFSRVPAGTYTLSETAVPPGYRLSDKTYTVVVEPGCDQVFDYYYANDRLPNLTLRKLDSITSDVLEGVPFKFEYRDTSGGAYEDYGTFYTDENGEINLTDLPVGWWRATEVEPPHGYQLDPSTGESQEFYLDGNEDRTITFKNTPLSAIIVYKTDESGQSRPLGGAVFELRFLGGDISGSGGVTIGRYTTSVNGTVVITGLKRGYYIIEEKIPPEGHSLSGESIQTVFISGNDQDIISVYFRNYRNPDFLLIKRDASDKATPLPGAVYKITDSGGGVIGDNNGLFETSADGTISIRNLTPGMTLLVQEVQAPDGYVLDPKVYTAKLDGSGAYELILYNEPLKEFVLTKLDGSDKKTPLPGTEYYITFADGGIVPGGENGYFKTDSAGKITLTGLKTGDVIKIKETKTKDDSYILDGSVYTYTIEAGSNAKTFYNERKGGLLLIKRDSSSNALLPGVQYRITHADGTFVGGSNGLFTTDANGEIRLLQTFEPGTTLIITEVKAKDGYLLDETVHTITIKDPNTLYTITAYNTPIGGVEVTKVDANTIGTRIPNIEFELRHMNGAYVGKYTTDKNGRFFVALEPGWYTLVETNTGKSGYFNLSQSALGLMAGEVVTEVRLEFGTVEAGFRSVRNPTITVKTSGNLTSGYQIANTAEVGGTYRGAKENSQAKWVTKVVRYNQPSLPKTGY